MRDIYDIETKSEAIDVYTEHFGGFPYYLFMGADEGVIINEVVKALELDREIEAEEGVVY
nr:MAG TPA_asm: OHCU decarboxylase [Caudoviricetes sp.]